MPSGVVWFDFSILQTVYLLSVKKNICIQTDVKLDAFTNLLLQQKRDRCALFLLYKPADYLSVKDNRLLHPWQAKGLSRDAIRASTGNLCLTRADCRRHRDTSVPYPPNVKGKAHLEYHKTASPSIYLFASSWWLAITCWSHRCEAIIRCKLIKLGGLAS